MIKVASVEKVIEAEEKIVSEGCSVNDLIERAAEAIFGFIQSDFRSIRKIAVAVGLGNNGSDALSVALRLIKNGKDVTVYSLPGCPNVYNKERREKLRLFGVEVMDADSFSGEFDLIIDGLFGTGINRNLDVGTVDFINKLNAAEAVRLSIDIPSGLSAVTGDCFKTAVCADFTIALGAVKPGLLFGVAKNYTGKIVCSDIGLPVCEIGYIAGKKNVMLVPRQKAAHKGNFGKISVIGGSDCMPGAPLMSYESAVAASKCGAGVVRLCVGEHEKCAYKSRVKEQTLFFMPETDGYISFCQNSLDEIIGWSNVIAIGMGMGKNSNLPKIINYIASKFEGTLIIDADGLNSLSTDLDIIKDHVCKLILTPHIGEFSRLFPDIKPYEIEKIKTVARDNGLTIVLKSANTVITDGSEVCFTTTGTPAMAKGGSGDVLAGMISAFSAVLPPIKACVTACYYFGKAGERAAEKMDSEVSVMAGDIIIQAEELFGAKTSK